MKYPKVINYYLSIISSWEFISLLMGQSPRQTCKQKRDDTFIQILCTSRKKINVYTLTDGRDLYLSPPLLCGNSKFCFIHCFLKFSLRCIPFLLQFPIPSREILVFSMTLPLNFWPYRRRDFSYADHFFILVPSKGVDLL